MHAPVELADIAADVLARIRDRAPRVHCITNTVAQNYTANMLLAGPPSATQLREANALLDFVEGQWSQLKPTTDYYKAVADTHARNLDADLYNWNVATTLFLIDETDNHPGWHRYVAFGTAGLIYPGGISGLNDAGIAVSLHQLSTTHYRTHVGTGVADIAPIIQQRVLREAGTLEQAVEIIRSVQPFSAWVIFCSDAAAGRASAGRANPTPGSARRRRRTSRLRACPTAR